MWPNPQFPADLVTFTKEILKWKLHFLCSVGQPEKMINFIREIISDQMESSQPAFSKLTGPLPYNYYQGGPAHQMIECCSHISHKSLRSNQFPKNFRKLWNGPLCRNASDPSSLLDIAACWKSAKKLSQILGNNIDNDGREIGLRIYLRYCGLAHI